jgi:hypothetical protein
MEFIDGTKGSDLTQEPEPPTDTMSWELVSPASDFMKFPHLSTGRFDGVILSGNRPLRGDAFGYPSPKYGYDK